MKHPNVELRLAVGGKGSVKIDGREFPATEISVSDGIGQSTQVTMTFHANVNIVDDDTDK